MTVAELNIRMSAREFAQWMEYFRHEPFGPVRDNLHAGLVASMLYNANRAKGKPAMQASDFIFLSPEDRRQDNTRKAIAGLRAMARVKNGN